MVRHAIARGDGPAKMVAECGVTLREIEEIRDAEARLRGAFVVGGAEASELGELLEIESVDAEKLVVRVRDMVERAVRLAGENAWLRSAAKL